MTDEIQVDPGWPPAQLAAALAPAGRALRAGRLVAFPTETVYGLGACATDAEAVARIFEAKGRPATNPLIVHVASAEQARALVSRWPERAERLARLWPGPLTLVLERGPQISDQVTAGLDSVALRLPDHPIARALIEVAGCPVCAPSANRYTHVSPTRAEHVRRSLGEAVDVLIDGGPTRVGVESTVVSLLGPRARLLRPGMLGADAIERALGEPLERAPDDLVVEGRAALAPGQARRHYSPSGRVVLCERVDLAGLGSGEGALVCGSPPAEAATLAPGAQLVALPAEPGAYARGLYEALHLFDSHGCPVIYVQRVPRSEPWCAIRDRLRRAAAD